MRRLASAIMTVALLAACGGSDDTEATPSSLALGEDRRLCPYRRGFIG
jgi:nitrous oxide reductase accessory protein NosL